jgi:hypothetical protein
MTEYQILSNTTWMFANPDVNYIKNIDKVIENPQSKESKLIIENFNNELDLANEFLYVSKFKLLKAGLEEEDSNFPKQIIVKLKSAKYKFELMDLESNNIEITDSDIFDALKNSEDFKVSIKELKDNIKNPEIENAFDKWNDLIVDQAVKVDTTLFETVRKIFNSRLTLKVLSDPQLAS